jgi:alpha-D-ribose 1-methylphosphonate 5-triphosphate diphosphatase
VRYAEFAVDEETARATARLGMPLVLGAPNVIRDGSHNGQIHAARAIAQGWCTVLCSDYHLPSLFHAPFVLARTAAMPLVESWRLVSRNPARLLGLRDRGDVAPGMMADVIVLRRSHPPEIAAVIKRGVVRALGDVGHPPAHPGSRTRPVAAHEPSTVH